MKKLLISIMMCMVLVSLVSATATLGTIKQESCFDLLQTCTNCSVVNVSSITFPNKTTVPYNVDMANTGGSTWIYSNCNLSLDLGEYSYNTNGDPDGVVVNQPVSYTVNLIGEELTQAKTNLYFILLIIAFIFFGLTFYGAIKFPFRNQRDDDGRLISINDFKYVKIVMFILCYLEFLFIMSISKNLAGGFLVNGGLYEFLNIVYTLLLIGMIPFFPCLLFIIVMIWINDKKMQDALQRGLEV